MSKLILTIIISSVFSFKSSAQCWQQISSGVSQTAAVKSDGTLWAWGDNKYGQLGIGSNKSSLLPIQVGSDSDWKLVSTGSTHCVALKNDGTLWAWGGNYWGQVGDGTTVQKKQPLQIGKHKIWTKVAAGFNHNIALASDSTIWAWGNNRWSQLTLAGGQYGVEFKSEMVQIGTLHEWIDVLAGGDHNFSMKNDSTLWGWGQNENGQLGIGEINQNTYYRSSPTLVLGNQKWKNLSAGSDHTSGINSDRNLWLWGSNTKGQIGDGTNIQSNIPIMIDNNAEWIDVSCGSIHTMAVKSDNTLWSWGSNQYGQLGDGSIEDNSWPNKIGPNQIWKNVFAGYGYSFAIDIDGKLYAWGNNEYGQLGTGDLLDRISPHEVSCPTTIKEGSPTSLKLEIAPNPTYDEIILNVIGNNSVELKYKIISILGHVIQSGKIFKNNERFSVNNLSSGVYLIVLNSDNYSTSNKFVKL